MDISLKQDFFKLTKKLMDSQKIVNQAIYGTINSLSYNGMLEEKKELLDSIDKPIPFTQKGILYKKATRSKLIAQVYIRDEVYDYLIAIVEGKPARAGKGRWGTPHRILPVGKEWLNQYGNLSPQKTMRAIALAQGSGTPKINAIPTINYSKMKTLKKNNRFFYGAPTWALRKGRNELIGYWEVLPGGKLKMRLRADIGAVKVKRPQKIFDFGFMIKRFIKKNFTEIFQKELLRARLLKS